MAQSSENHTYKQGHDKYSTATHERRTAESDASFLLPHIRQTDRVLDVGCGPGTITTGFTRYATSGKVVGIDLSAEVLHKAGELAAQLNIPDSGPGSVVFKQANVLERLPFDDDTFDVVFASQVLGHMPLPDAPVRALTEMRRVLKPGGVLATRDGNESHAYPRSLELQRLFFDRQALVLQNRKAGEDSVTTLMPALYRRAGFDADAGRICIGSSTNILYQKGDRQWMAARMAGLLKEGSVSHQNWLRAGYTVLDVQEAVLAIQGWADTEDAWFLSVQCEMLAWK